MLCKYDAALDYFPNERVWKCLNNWFYNAWSRTLVVSVEAFARCKTFSLFFSLNNLGIRRLHILRRWSYEDKDMSVLGAVTQEMTT